MDSDQGKLFIGGISWETTEEKLNEYFQGYGEVLQTVVMRDKITGKPRGFGFVVFADPNVLDRVLQDSHVIDGRTVEAKRALSREEQQGSRSGNVSSARNFGGGGNTRTKKIFVGGLPPTLTEDGFRNYFETYGSVTDVALMYDQQTNRPRGFGFISFDSEDAVDRVLHKTFHDLNGKQVEVKRALPKDANPSGGGRSMGYGASGEIPSSYDRMDTNRYMQSQNTTGGYPPYGSSGYGASGYGYGASNNGMGYGGYGSYGGANPGYGGVNPGFGGPGVSAFGNPNVAGTGYGTGLAGGPRSSWGSQGPSGYGNMGYGNASWGASGAGGGGGPTSGGSAARQSPTGAIGYGNQGYGYGDASGDAQSGAGGYNGSGYGDASGNSSYGNSTWRSDTSQGSGNYGTQQNVPHGGQVGYGGGYGGGAPSQQAQQH